MLTPLGVGPGQPFPYISGLSLSLGVLARDPDSGEERFARVKVPEQLPRFVAVGEGRLLIPLEEVIGHYLDSLFPGMEILEHGCFRVTRDADMELSRRRRRPARGGAGGDSQASLRRRRASRGRVPDVGGDARPVARRPSRHGRRDLPDPRPARPLRSDADRGARPPGVEGRAVEADHAGPSARRARRRRVLRRDPAQRHLRPPSVRVVHLERRALHRRRVDRSGGSGAEDDRVPDERRVSVRAGARSRRRGREAKRVPRRAEGALRRGTKHRAGASRSRRPASTSSTASPISRSTRRRRSSSAARATGFAATSISAPATTTRSRRASTRTSASSRLTRRSRPTSPTSSTT